MDQAVDEDGNDGIELEEFITHFGDVLAANSDAPLTRAELKQLFMKIDADGNGSVDWDEFTNYMFLMRAPAPEDEDDDVASQYLPLEFVEADDERPGTRHPDVITCVEYLVGLDAYATGSKDGRWRLWNASDFAKTAETRNGDGTAWITAVCDLTAATGRHARVAVSALDRSVSVYTFRMGGKIELTGRFIAPGSMGAPMCLAAATVAGEDRLVFGSGSGQVVAMTCNLDADYVPLVGSVHGLNLHRDDVLEVHQAHSDWVTRVLHVEELNAFASSSMDGRVVVVDARARVDVPEQKGRFRERINLRLFPKGVYDTAWCRSQSLFASCGVGREVALWNGSTGHVVATLSGHAAPVTRVAVDDARLQVVSMSTDNTIKVWDMRTNKCVQTMVDDNTYRVGSRVVESLTVMTHDPRERRLITGVTELAAWRQAVRTREDQSHEYPVVGSLYNCEFDAAVSADEDGNIHVWNVDTGHRDERFTDAHPGSRLSALAFDVRERRLLTGASDGSVRMWNHNNGQLLKEMFHRQPAGEVTRVLHVADEERGARLIVAAGWNRKVIAWPETEGSRLEDHRVMSGHDEDILCAANCAGTDLVATGDYGGRIALWNVFSAFKRAVLQIETSDPYDRACESLCFLSARSDILEGPVLLSGGADGTLRAWLTNPEETSGEDPRPTPRATVRAAAESEEVTTIATDPENHHVFTGDSAGHVRVFDVSGLNLSGVDATGSATDRSSTIVELGAWRPHRRAVASIEYLPSRRLLMIASVDARVDLWTLEGARVGVFGRPATWNTRGEPRRTPGGGDAPTRERPWRIDEMVEVRPNLPPSTERADAVRRVLREKFEASLGIGGEAEDGRGSPEEAARRFVEERRAAAAAADWSDYQKNLTHSSLLMHQLQRTPASPKEGLRDEEGRVRVHESPPPTAKERLRGTGRALKKFHL